MSDDKPDDDTERINLRLTSKQVEALSRSTLMRLLEQLWLEAFAKGMEVGMQMASLARKTVAEHHEAEKTKKKRKRKTSK